MIKASALVDFFKTALAEKWGYIWGTAGIKWTEAKQKQKVDYMISKYGASWAKNADAKKDNYYMAASIGKKWIGHIVADCSGMFRKAFAVLGGAIAHGSNSIYDRYCSKKGKITAEIRKNMLPGTAVFVDHSGNKSHIGLYVGNGKVIEAASTEAGVCTSNITAGKWTYYGLLKGVDYTDEQPAPGDSSEPTLKRGCKGDWVMILQTKLITRGYKLPKYGADGDFGAETENAVKAFQKDHGLDADGVVGPATWAALEHVDQRPLYTVVIPHLTEQAADAIIKANEGAYKEKEVG